MTNVANQYSMCGHPAWSDSACQKCEGCRDGRAQLRRTLSAANEVVAYYDNDKSGLGPAIDKLRDAVSWGQK